MKELRALIEAAKAVLLELGMNNGIIKASDPALVTLRGAIAAAKKADPTTLRLAGELALGILAIDLLKEIFEAERLSREDGEMETAITLEPGEWKPLYEKALELKEVLDR